MLLATALTGPVEVEAADEALFGNPVYSATEQSPPGDFYTPPDPLPQGLPGTIIKQERMEDAPAGIVAARIMCLSANTRGEPTAVTGMVTRPDTPATYPARPLVAFAHGTFGIGRECSMSQDPFTPGTAGASMYDQRVRPLVDAGYVVVSPDYEGNGAPGNPTYLVQKTEGYNVLDGLRAAVYLEPQFIDAQNLGVYGHSQGGHAALSAGAEYSTYAPELMIQGIVASAPGLVPPIPLALDVMTANPGNATEAATRAAYTLNIMASWTKNFPDQLDPEDVLEPAGVEALPLAEKYCQGNLKSYLDKPFSEYVRSDPSPRLLALVEENMPVEQRIDIPLLVMQGEQDTDVSPQLTRAAVQTLCQQGSTVDFFNTANDSHESLVWTARPAEITWLQQRFNGEPAPNTCRSLT